MTPTTSSVPNRTTPHFTGYYWTGLDWTVQTDVDVDAEKNNNRKVDNK